MNQYISKLPALLAAAILCSCTLDSIDTKSLEDTAVPIESLPWKHDLYSVFFVDSKTGYAVGKAHPIENDSGTYAAPNRIHKTTDGGATWIQISTGEATDLNTVQFLDGGHGVAKGHSPLFSTSNAGATWTKTVSNEDINPAISMHFINTRTGWYAGWNRDIFKTENGGATWQQQETGLFNADYQEIRFLNENIGWAVGRNHVNASGLVLKTTNGGSNWITQATPFAKVAITFPHPNLGNLDPIAEERYYSVHVLDEENVWIAGARGTIKKTTNGGTTWQNQTTGTFKILRCIRFLDELSGWAVGDSGTVLKTTDGGNNWTVYASGTPKNLRSIFLLNSSLGWIVGDDMALLRTDTLAPTAP